MAISNLLYLTTGNEVAWCLEGGRERERQRERERERDRGKGREREKKRGQVMVT